MRELKFQVTYGVWTLYIDWYLYLGIICYKYVVNPDSAEYQAIRSERMLEVIYSHSILKASVYFLY